MKQVVAFIITSIYCIAQAQAQVIGGESMMQYLRLPRNAHATALGGMVVCNPSADVMLSLANPALLRPEFNNELGISNNFYLGKAQFSNAVYAWHSNKYNTSFSTSVSSMQYANTVILDPAGINYGNNTFASDINLQASASRQYTKYWRYGATARFAYSRLASNIATAVMGDAGVVYANTDKQIYCGMLVKNIGVVTSRYTTGRPSEPLPFDMQIGFSKKFLKAPFRINILAHHLYQWDIRYNNPADLFNSSLFGIDSSQLNRTYFGDKLMRHFNFGVDLLLGKRLELNVGYSHLRRRELSLVQKQGLTGFSFGLGVLLPKFKIYYGNSVYHLSGSYHEVCVVLNTKQLFGIGAPVVANNAVW
jgi:hypothetical protein